MGIDEGTFEDLRPGRKSTLLREGTARKGKVVGWLTEHDNTQHITVLHGCSVYAVSPVSEMGVWIGLHRLSID